MSGWNHDYDRLVHPESRPARPKRPEYWCQLCGAQVRAGELWFDIPTCGDCLETMAEAMREPVAPADRAMALHAIREARHALDR